MEFLVFPFMIVNVFYGWSLKREKKLNAFYIVQILQCIVYKSLLILRNFFGYVMSLQYNSETPEVPKIWDVS